MNCRRVSNLLSAYLDAELTGSEMLEIRAHLDHCPACRAEHQTLRDTKRLLASLALQAPRAEFEALLRTQVRRDKHAPIRWLPLFGVVSRPRPFVAAAALSFAALLLASAHLGTPPQNETASALAPTPEYPPTYIEPQYIYASSLPSADPMPLTWSGGDHHVITAGYRSILFNR